MAGHKNRQGKGELVMVLTYKDWMKIIAQSGIELKISKGGTKIKAIQNGQIVAEEKTDKLFKLAQKIRRRR